MNKIIVHTLFFLLSIVSVFAAGHVDVVWFCAGIPALHGGVINNIIRVNALHDIEGAVQNNETTLVFKVRVHAANPAHPTNQEISNAIFETLRLGYTNIFNQHINHAFGGPNPIALEPQHNSVNNVSGRNAGAFFSNNANVAAHALFLAAYQRPNHLAYNNDRKNAAQLDTSGFTHVQSGRSKNQGLFTYNSLDFSNVAAVGRRMAQYLYHTEAKLLGAIMESQVLVGTIPAGFFDGIPPDRVRILSFSTRDMCPLCTSLALNTFLTPAALLDNQANVAHAVRQNYDFIFIGSQLMGNPGFLHAVVTQAGAVNALNGVNYDAVNNHVAQLVVPVGQTNRLQTYVFR